MAKNLRIDSLGQNPEKRNAGLDPERRDKPGTGLNRSEIGLNRPEPVTKPETELVRTKPGGTGRTGRNTDEPAEVSVNTVLTRNAD